MKLNALKCAAVALLAVLSLVAASPARAGTRYRADIPFAFTVGNTTLPAGAYRLSVIGPGVVVMRNENRGQDAAIAMADFSQQDNVKLIFHRSGNRYSLGQVQTLQGSTELLARKAPGAVQEVVAISVRQG